MVSSSLRLPLPFKTRTYFEENMCHFYDTLISSFDHALLQRIEISTKITLDWIRSSWVNHSYSFTYLTSSMTSTLESSHSGWEVNKSSYFLGRWVHKSEGSKDGIFTVSSSEEELNPGSTTTFPRIRWGHATRMGYVKGWSAKVWIFWYFMWYTS